MNHQQFKDKRLGKWVDFDGAYGNQCVDLAKQYVKEVYGFVMWPVGSAKDCSLVKSFHNDKRWSVYLPDTGVSMKQGDVLISAPTKTNEHGHIGIVDSIDGKWYWLLEQNTAWGGTKTTANAIKVRKVLRGKPPILKFFRFTA